MKVLFGSATTTVTTRAFGSVVERELSCQIVGPMRRLCQIQKELTLPILRILSDKRALSPGHAKNPGTSKNLRRRVAC